MQAPDHVAHYGASLLHAVGLLDGGAQLVMHRLPVETAELRIIVLVAHRGPDVFKRFDILLALLGCQREGEEGAQQNAAEQADSSHSFSRSFAQSAPPRMGNTVNGIKLNKMFPTSEAGSCIALLSASA